MTDADVAKKQKLEQEWDMLTQERKALEERRWRTRRAMMQHVAERVDWQSDWRALQEIKRQLEAVRERWWRLHEQWLPLEEAELGEEAEAEAQFDAIYKEVASEEEYRAYMDEKARMTAEHEESMKQHFEELHQWAAAFKASVQQWKKERAQ
jgi:hypothetical protein